MIIATVALLVMIAGLLLWFIPLAGPTGAKVNEAGKWMFVTGLLALLLAQGGHVAHFG